MQICSPIVFNSGTVTITGASLLTNCGHGHVAVITEKNEAIQWVLSFIDQLIKLCHAVTSTNEMKLLKLFASYNESRNVQSGSIMEKTAAGMKKTNKTHVVYKKNRIHQYIHIHITYIHITDNAKVMGEFYKITMVLCFPLVLRWLKQRVANECEWDDKDDLHNGDKKEEVMYVLIDTRTSFGINVLITWLCIVRSLEGNPSQSRNVIRI